MTQKSIKDAFAHLRDDTEMQPLEDAARARSEADWLVGMNASRAATTKIGSRKLPLSLGRVQTPTLAIVVRRDLEIAAFVPEDYWQIRAPVRDRRGRELPRPVAPRVQGPPAGRRRGRGDRRRGGRHRRPRRRGRAQAGVRVRADAVRPDGPAARRQLAVRLHRHPHAGRRPGLLRAAQGHHLPADELPVPVRRPGVVAALDRPPRRRRRRGLQGARRLRVRARRAAARQASSTTRRSPTTTRSSRPTTATRSRPCRTTSAGSTTWSRAASSPRSIPTPATSRRRSRPRPPRSASARAARCSSTPAGAPPTAPWPTPTRRSPTTRPTASRTCRCCTRATS